MKINVYTILVLSSFSLSCSLSSQSNDYKLVWSDEFSGQNLNDNFWNVETGSDGWGNNELQNYTESDNLEIKDGNLFIYAKKDLDGNYTSGRIETKNKKYFTYGKVEARIKLPYGKGIWPAFWMMGNNIDDAGYPTCGEIDILELVGGDSEKYEGLSDSIIWVSIHKPTSNGIESFTAEYTNDEIFTNNYHIFGIEWDKEKVSYYVDGNVFFTNSISKNDLKNEPFHKPFFIILNVAVGGDWPGNPDEDTVWPQAMVVDWIRVYQR